MSIYTYTHIYTNRHSCRCRQKYIEIDTNTDKYEYLDSLGW